MNNPPDLPPSRPLAARLGAGFALTIEALALAVAGAAYVVYGVADTRANTAFALSVAALAFAFALALGAAGWGVWRGRRWAASLSLTWQVIQVAVGVYIFGGRPFLGLGLIGVAALAVAGTLRSSRAQEV